MSRQTHTDSRKNRDDAIYRGEIVYWNDKKGYGFIESPVSETNIFFHISSFAYNRRRPEKGAEIAFLLQKEVDRIQASRVVLRGHENTLFTHVAHDEVNRKTQLFETSIYIILVLLFYVVLATVSTPISLASMVISVLTMMLYSLDKHAALTEQQRVPEASLHIASLLGGWPGALIARPLLRHKISKNRFILFFWMSVVVNFFSLYIITWYLPPL